jgi:hypothetical protein
MWKEAFVVLRHHPGIFLRGGAIIAEDPTGKLVYLSKAFRTKHIQNM